MTDESVGPNVERGTIEQKGGKMDTAWTLKRNIPNWRSVAMLILMLLFGSLPVFAKTGGHAAARPQAGGTQKPNIVVIWGDDIGQSDISAYSMGLMGFHTP